jgi:hypothetical protein
MDDKMLKAGGEAKRRELIRQMEELTIVDRTVISQEEEYKGKFGDLGQAENLLAQKRGFKK